MGNQKKKGTKMDNGAKFMKLIDYLNALQGNEFTGYIKVNFSQGTIGRIEKFEEVLKHGKEKS
ncbi:MAG: hypothetical protein SWQ30_14525 [Thermodesulfobacteriota bacterium]|nr:hypothetical protein [Thermodesulfobacteriota bacterium]